MSEAESPHVLIVDDDRALSTMLAELLQEEGFRCTTAADGAEGLGKIQESAPDLVVLDVMMPGDDGVSTLRRLRESSRIPVLMLTAMGADDDRILGLEAGADDYLAKPFVARELVLRIRAILNRAYAANDPNNRQADVLTAGPLTVDLQKDRVTLGDAELNLTGAELRILAALVEKPGEITSREHLTEFALGRKYTPYDRALDTHVSHLRRKLAEGDAAHRCEIRSVRGTGYKLVIK
ncbi:MAG: response regulator transcription factor [Gammaproteobacteria bacterium]|nr:response regulator transcription factor [Gammaproteobacteria bacterium]